ncbi:TIGR02253 family HAD-type hydrolase [Pyrococcus abyssi]|uniref:Glyceraldehyde 3-phosphate phosphatase n=1 Tax=Pyrococcus abyssi (strain GE5 / Orsay) TaxID=272844 RepID=G3PP_PYRAB|nr:TIGR02253 family HAD-type hydrolase [Pyrococcus abyssi]Q9V1B3.1 RecName: Full=Glyceraldehyde 3-phosphate phosphatase [Pyrococcus abyssi GE5]CAB49436.1 Haloacid dehalogenase-like hydrolase, putative [Pyrococcus abyssi GE5]CCE69903.1 TPA: hydrolase related to 2-haloalkanoic acid dehalogenase [Pyrococcus abyssi GE5]
MIKVIFFDLDDTLVDTTKLAELARRNAIENMIRHGLPVDFETAYSELMELIKEYGSNFPHHFDYLLRRLDLPYNPKWVSAGVIAYHNTKFAYLREVPGARKVLIRLRELGYRLGIITDGNPVKQWEKILRLEIDDFFEHVIISDFEGVKKPHPKIFKKALKAFNVDAQEALMVGDRLYSDIYGAKNVGMKTVWFKYGKYSKEELEYREYADYEIEKLQDLLKVIENENGSNKEVHPAR